jgi:hypothetical protein
MSVNCSTTPQNSIQNLYFIYVCLTLNMYKLKYTKIFGLANISNFLLLLPEIQQFATLLLQAWTYMFFSDSKTLIQTLPSSIMYRM